jgi:hypothetical protein
MITSKAWVGNVDLAIGLKRFKNALKPKNQMLSFKRQVLDKPTDIGLLPYFLGFLSCFLFMGAFLVFGHALLASPMSLTFFVIRDLIAIQAIGYIIITTGFVFLILLLVNIKEEYHDDSVKVTFFLFFISSLLCGILSATLLSPISFFGFIPTAVLFIVISTICVASFMLWMIHLND